MSSGLPPFPPSKSHFPSLSLSVHDSPLPLSVCEMASIALWIPKQYKNNNHSFLGFEEEKGEKWVQWIRCWSKAFGASTPKTSTSSPSSSPWLSSLAPMALEKLYQNSSLLVSLSLSLYIYIYMCTLLFTMKYLYCSDHYRVLEALMHRRIASQCKVWPQFHPWP